MAQYQPLSHGIYCLDALYIKPQVASIYLLVEGDEAAIIETGTYYSVDNVLATLDQLGIAKSQVKYVIPTHVHLDHAGGAGEMMLQFDQARLIIHPRGAPHMINPEKLIAGTIAVYGQEKFDQLYGKIEPVDEARIIVAEDLDRVAVKTRELIFIDSPGHARHHFCIYDQTSNGIFSGDTLGISYGPMKRYSRGLIPTTPPTQFDPEALHKSVNRVLAYKPEKLYLTHYGEFQNPLQHASSFNRWIDQYVATCEQNYGADTGNETTLRQKLADLIIGELPDSEKMSRILQTDIQLNAQGLDTWWRRSRNG